MTISYHDANFYHNFITGRSVIGVLHMLNKTPVDCHSKKKSKVETATCGSGYSSARTCVENILDLRINLRYLGVPLRKLSYMFGYNDNVVNSSMTPHGKTHKIHVALSFHRVREAIVAKIIACHLINGKINSADILIKHWDYYIVLLPLKPLLIWKEDTMECLDNNTLELEE